MLAGVLEVSETQVRDVMIPRSQMVVIDIDEDFDEILRVIVESGHSRFPVTGEDRDEVLGILLAKDLLRYFGSDAAKDVPLRKLLAAGCGHPGVEASQCAAQRVPGQPQSHGDRRR